MTEENKTPVPTLLPVPKAEKAPKVKTVPYTYIGGGEDSPAIIKFMDKVDFMIGEVTDIPVTDENAKVLEKIKDNPCFVEGKVDKKEIIEKSQKSKEKANEQRKENAKTETKAQRANAGK